MAAPWAEGVEVIAGELAQTLSERPSHGLVLVFGATTADLEVAMVATLTRLPRSDHARWHRLELHGIEASTSYEPGAMVWVVGFDSVEPEERVEALLALNRARDSIRGIGVRVVIWLPESLREAVFLHAADLLAWQDLMLSAPAAGLTRELGLPPWHLARDLAAGWANAVVGPWLWAEELGAARVLLARLPWAGIVGVDVGTGALEELGVPWGESREVRDLAELYDNPTVGVAPAGYLIGGDAQWWPEQVFWVQPPPPLPIVPVGVGTSPWDDGPSAEASCWVHASEPHQGWEWPGSAEDGPPALVLTVALGLLVLSAGRPEPTRWSRAVPLEPTFAEPLPPCVLVWGAEIGYDKDGPPNAPLPSRWAKLEQNEVRSDPIGARMARLEQALPGSKAARIGVAIAHGLDTNHAVAEARTLLGRFRGAILVLGHDRHVEGTLDALGRRYRVVDEDLDPLAEDDLVIVRPWTWSALQGRLGRTATEVDAWRRAARGTWSRLITLMERGSVVVGVRPDDPELLWWTLRSAVPWALHGPVWVYPPRTSTDSATSAGALLGFDVQSRSAQWWLDPQWADLDDIQARVVGHIERARQRASLPQPPLPMPAEPEIGIVWDLMHPFTVRFEGGPPQGLMDALATAERERWALPPTVDALTVLSLTQWIRDARAAWPDQPRSWVHWFGAPSHDIEFFGVDRRGRASPRSFERWVSALTPADASVVVVYLPPLGGGFRDARYHQAMMDVLRAATTHPNLKIVVADHSGHPWALEQQIPTRVVAVQDVHWPDAYARWVAGRNPTLAGLVPWLRARASERDATAALLSSPQLLSSLADTLRDPVDPLGPGWNEWIAGLTEGAGDGSFDAQLLRRRAEPDLGAEVTVAPADYTIGAPGERTWPPRRITLPGFTMATAPVSVRQYRGFMAAGGYRRADLWSAEGWAWRDRERVEAPATFEGARSDDDAPVVGVSWYEAEAFCRWCKHDLPTEVRWEAAFRRALAEAENDGGASTAPPFDGGVFEWCADWHDALYPKVAPRQDPRGPSIGRERVVRGLPHREGLAPDASLIAQRRHAPPDARRPDLGFRVMRDPEATFRRSDLKGLFGKGP
jgi:formylglycine-generating enzyme required for sulfatase activity